MSIVDEKKQLRKKMLALRDGLDRDQAAAASRAVLERIMTLPAFSDQELIYLYLAFRNELDTLSMIPAFQAAGKRLAVPRIEGKEMHFYQIASLSDCQPGTMGILEPKRDPNREADLKNRVTEGGLMLMPGLAFDRDHHRLGFGGGFYDRYLSEHSNLLTVGICYDFQIVDQVPNEDFDLCPEVVVSDRRLLCRKDLEKQ